MRLDELYVITNVSIKKGVNVNKIIFLRLILSQVISRVIFFDGSKILP